MEPKRLIRPFQRKSVDPTICVESYNDFIEHRDTSGKLLSKEGILNIFMKFSGEKTKSNNKNII